MTKVPLTTRQIPDRLTHPFQSALFSWQSLLLLVAVMIFIVNCFATPYFLSPWSLSDATFNFTEKALIALAMALVIISGEIDLSVAAIIAFASTMMGLALQFGVGTPGLVAVGILTGLICGAFNGVLVTGLGLPSIVVTIGTMSFFRGLSFIVLGDQAYKGYPTSFAFFGQGYVWWVISFEFVLFEFLRYPRSSLRRVRIFTPRFAFLEVTQKVPPTGRSERPTALPPNLHKLTALT